MSHYLARIGGGRDAGGDRGHAAHRAAGRSAPGHFERALELFEKVGDRRGVMSHGDRHGVPALRPGHPHGRRTPPSGSRRSGGWPRGCARFTTESERAVAEAQMLFGSHVFARAKMIPDLARGPRRGGVPGGRGAWATARWSSWRPAGWPWPISTWATSTGAERWLDRAAAAAAAAPTPLRVRRLELWRGLLAARPATRRRCASTSSGRSGRPRAGRPGRAVRAAGPAGPGGGPPGRRAAATRSCWSWPSGRRARRRDLSRAPPAHPPWGAQADAALAEVALARGRRRGGRWRGPGGGGGPAGRPSARTCSRRCCCPWPGRCSRRPARRREQMVGFYVRLHRWRWWPSGRWTRRSASGGSGDRSAASSSALVGPGRGRGASAAIGTAPRASTRGVARCWACSPRG